jgi:hypothetical protein
MIKKTPSQPIRMLLLATHRANALAAAIYYAACDE